MKTDINDENELKKMAPRLFSVQKENPFKVPDGYFDSLADNILHEVQSLPDFEKTAQENVFKVPEGYFDSLPTVIQQRIIDEKANKRSIGEWISSLLPKPQYSLAFASLAIIAVFSVKYLTRTITVEPSLPDTAQLSYSDLSNSTFISDIDESVLADALAEQTTSSAEQKDQSLEDYLIDNNIDINQLTEHL